MAALPVCRTTVDQQIQVGWRAAPAALRPAYPHAVRLERRSSQSLNDSFYVCPKHAEISAAGAVFFAQ